MRWERILKTLKMRTGSCQWKRRRHRWITGISFGEPGWTKASSTVWFKQQEFRSRACWTFTLCLRNGFEKIDMGSQRIGLRHDLASKKRFNRKKLRSCWKNTDFFSWVNYLNPFLPLLQISLTKCSLFKRWVQSFNSHNQCVLKFIYFMFF